MPSISLPVNSIVWADVGNVPNSTSTFNPFAPGVRSKAACIADWLTSMFAEFKVKVLLATVKEGVCLTFVDPSWSVIVTGFVCANLKPS